MELRISPLTSQTLGAVGAAAQQPDGPLGVGSDFAENLKMALKTVSRAQNDASQLQTQVQLGNPKVSLEETMLAMQKAQIGFQATLHVRNRLVQAYTDIMNMSV